MSLAAVSHRYLGETLMDGLAAKFVEPQKAWSAP
jgi:hypothetical protein